LNQKYDSFAGPQGIDALAFGYHRGIREAILGMNQTWTMQTTIQPPLAVIETFTKDYYKDTKSLVAVDKFCADYVRAQAVAYLVRKELDSYYFAEDLGLYFGVKTWYMIMHGHGEMAATNGWQWQYDGYNIIFDVRNLTRRPVMPGPGQHDCKGLVPAKNYNCVYDRYFQELHAPPGVTALCGALGPSFWYVVTGTGCYVVDNPADEIRLRLVNPGVSDNSENCQLDKDTWECSR